MQAMDRRSAALDNLEMFHWTTWRNFVGQLGGILLANLDHFGPYQIHGAGPCPIGQDDRICGMNRIALGGSAPRGRGEILSILLILKSCLKERQKGRPHQEETRSLGRTRRPRYCFATGRGVRREWGQTPCLAPPPLIQSSCEAVALASGFRRPLGLSFCGPLP